MCNRGDYVALSQIFLVVYQMILFVVFVFYFESQLAIELLCLIVGTLSLFGMGVHIYIYFSLRKAENRDYLRLSLINGPFGSMFVLSNILKLCCQITLIAVIFKSDIPDIEIGMKVLFLPIILCDLHCFVVEFWVILIVFAFLLKVIEIIFCLKYIYRCIYGHYPPEEVSADNNLELDSGDTEIPINDYEISLKLETAIYISENFSAKECSICQDSFLDNTQVSILKCEAKHVFHTQCIEPWLRQNTTCPLCRQIV